MPIVEAVGSIAISRHASLAKRIEQAQTEAVRDALANGVSLEDSETILALKQAARQAVKDEFKK